MSELTLERFEQAEKRAEERHQELMLSVAGVITEVNDHIDERFGRLEQLLTMSRRVELMENFLVKKFGRDALAQAGL